MSATVAAVVFFGMVLKAPWLWWRSTSHAYYGRGTLDFFGASILFLRMLYECLYQAHSYYFFSTSPALGGVLIMPLLAAGVYASGRRPQTWWPLWLLAASSIALYCLAAQPTGMRRSIALVFVAALFLGLLYDTVASAQQWPQAKALAVAAWVILVLSFQTALTAQAYRDGSLALPHDFDWIDGDVKVLLDRSPVDSRIKSEVLRIDQPVRAMCLLHMLPPQRPEKSSGLFSRAEIRDYYLTHRSEQSR